MSNIIHNIKEKFSHHHHATESKTAANTKANAEPSFTIQPHPAKSNDPADLQPNPVAAEAAAEAFHAHEPYVPSDEIKNNMPAPLSHEELQARQAALRSEAPGHGTQQGNLM